MWPILLGFHDNKKYRHNQDTNILNLQVVYLYYLKYYQRVRNYFIIIPNSVFGLGAFLEPRTQYLRDKPTLRRTLLLYKGR